MGQFRDHDRLFTFLQVVYLAIYEVAASKTLQFGCSIRSPLGISGKFL